MGATLEQVTPLIHGWQRQAHRLPLHGFRHWALAQLAELLPLETAWWGRATLIDSADQPTVHDYTLHGLPASYLADWQTVASEDHIAQSLTENPQQPVITGADDPAMPASLRAVLLQHGIYHVLCCATADPIVGLNAQGSLAAGRLMNFVSLYRGSTASPFTAEEAKLLNHTLPNLAEALSSCYQ